MPQLNFTILISIIIAAQSVAAEVVLESDAVTKDYEDQLPRVAATEPIASLSKFQISDGFKIELVAHEPLVTDPVAMAFDEHGQLFVVCMRGYSEHAEDHLGVVRLLADTNDDGVFDRGTDYVNDLSWPKLSLATTAAFLLA